MRKLLEVLEILKVNLMFCNVLYITQCISYFLKEEMIT